MVFSRTQHANRGVVDVSAGETWEHHIDDGRRWITGIDLAGDVERSVYIESEDEGRIYPLGDTGSTIRGEGDTELDIVVSKNDTLVIEYEEAGEVSDLWEIRKSPPLNHTLQTLVSELEQ